MKHDDGTEVYLDGIPGDAIVTVGERAQLRRTSRPSSPLVFVPDGTFGLVVAVATILDQNDLRIAKDYMVVLSGSQIGWIRPWRVKKVWL